MDTDARRDQEAKRKIDAIEKRVSDGLCVGT